jgi:hypothetical protein
VRGKVVLFTDELTAAPLNASQNPINGAPSVVTGSSNPALTTRLAAPTDAAKDSERMVVKTWSRGSFMGRLSHLGRNLQGTQN